MVKHATPTPPKVNIPLGVSRASIIQRNSRRQEVTTASVGENLTPARQVQEKTQREIHPERSITSPPSLPTEVLWKIAESVDQPLQIARILSVFRGVCRKWREEFGDEKRWLKLYQAYFDPFGNFNVGVYRGCYGKIISRFSFMSRFSDTVDFEAYMTGKANETHRHVFSYWTRNTERLQLAVSQGKLVESETGKQWRNRFNKTCKRSWRRAYIDRLLRTCGDCYGPKSNRWEEHCGDCHVMRRALMDYDSDLLDPNSPLGQLLLARNFNGHLRR